MIANGVTDDDDDATPNACSTRFGVAAGDRIVVLPNTPAYRDAFVIVEGEFEPNYAGRLKNKRATSHERARPVSVCLPLPVDPLSVASSS